VRTLNLASGSILTLTAILTLAMIPARPELDFGAARASQEVEVGEDGPYTLDAFQAATAALTDESAYVALCQEYVERADDLDVVRAVQDRWHEVDPTGAVDFFRSWRKQDPESATAVYLYGRIAEDPLEKIELGRKVIAIDPEFSYGYRLVLGTYVEQLFQGQANAEEQALLVAELSADAPLFDELVRMFPDEDYPLDYLFDYQDYSGQYEAALQTLKDARDLEAQWARGTTFAYIYAKLGRFAEARQAIEEQVAEMVDQQRLTAEEGGEYVEYYFDYYLRKAGAYAGLIEYYQRDPGFGEDPAALFAVAGLYSLQDNMVMAFGHLQEAVDHGFDSPESLTSDEALAPLHEDPRWDDIVQKVRANWDAGRPQRKEAALAAKFSKPAPDWKLKDVDGREVTLTSLRGEIVILDFWATWCSPCRRAMPVLSSWLREKAPAGVRVFSINVWEPAPLKAKLFLVEHDYPMVLLFGNDDVVTAYGIEGIPYICAIDAAGNIRFEEKGYEEGLDEKLDWWVKDLQREGTASTRAN